MFSLKFIPVPLLGLPRLFHRGARGLLLFTPLGVGGTATAQLTLEDMFNPAFYEDHLEGLTHMNDGSHYCVLEDDAKGNSVIMSHDYRAGTVTDTIFSSAWFPSDDGSTLAVDGFTFSDDEQKMLIETNNEQIYRWSYTSDFQVFDRQARTLSDLNPGSQMYATFSPDGNRVAFVQDNNLYYKSINAAGSRLKQVTTDGLKNHIINGASDWVYEEELEITRAYEWSSNSRKIAFLRFDESAVKEWVMPKYTGLYPEIYTFKYPKAGEANSTVTLHVHDLDNGGTTQLRVDPGEEHYLPRIKWTRDPSVVTVQRLNRHQDHLELLAVNVNDGSIKKLVDETDKYYVEVHDNLQFLADNTFLWTSERSGYRHIYQFGMNGTMIRPVTSGNWEVTKVLGVNERSRVVYYQSAELSPLERHVFVIGLNGRGKTLLKEDSGTWDAEFSKAQAWCIMSHSSTSEPTRTAVLDRAMKEVRTLVNNGKLKETWFTNGLTTPSFFTFKTEGDVELNGWMLKPTNFDPARKYPVLMFVYGGPGSQTVTNRWGGRNTIWFQMLAQKGYIIACVDNRGTGARGSDFKKMTYLNLGKYETTDQVNAAKYLGTLGYIDKNRIGIFGWSYGGYMSSLCLMMGGDVFKMAIAVAPVTHWKFYDTIYTERFMRTPAENPGGYNDWAPISQAAGLKGKYLLIHGSADDNVHVQNTMEMVKALIEAGKDFDYFIYPDKNHGIGGRATRLHLYQMMTDFVLENL